jgi:hypothetical protein
MTESTRKRRLPGPRILWLVLTVIAASALLASTALAVVSDSGTYDVQVAADTDACPTETTTAGAKITYLSQDNPCGELGASGTGVFESFERLQASPNEEGFNTDTNQVLDNVDGKWTHSILVSDIPVISEGGQLYWELYADINEGNGGTFDQPHISLNDVDVYFSNDGALTDLGTADIQYDFTGAILINDVNSGSGRADLRYLIPVSGIDIPDNCGFKDPTCDVFFVLYSQWGLTLNYQADPVQDYTSDTGFEEWKVKNYPYVTVSKTAETTFTRTFAWTIVKSVTPDTWDLFTGDTGTSQYTVTVTKNAGDDSDWAVSGTITIDNPGTLDAVINSASDITDEISGAPTSADVDCGVTFPYTIDAGDSLECTYSADLPDGSDQTNTATVVLSAGTVFTGDADVIFGDPTTTVNDTINVDDSYAGDLGSFSDDGSATYERTFACDADEGTHNNTATIVETDQSDSASVTVNCYALEVSKDADTSFTRTYTWDILKESDDINGLNITLNAGETYDYHYKVTVDVDSFVDSDWAVSGDIDVFNPAPIDATINSVSDVISGYGAADNLDCGVSFPYTLVAGDTLTCSYDAALPDASSRTNTATATLQNYDYDWSDPPVASGTTDFSGTANVTFSDTPTDEVDECVDVTDDHGGFLGTVCASDDLPAVFTYTLTIGPYTADQCGPHTFTNTASFETNDTSTTGESSVTVNIDVPCEGCTLTQGYWKTHSDYGPAKKSDPTWDLLPGGLGPDTVFYLSEQTWYEVFWTAPKGNAYYILAHQYEAAVLNILSGAGSTAQVDATIALAEDFFETYTPTDWPKSMRGDLIQWAGILGSYNEGLTGPGPCDADQSAISASSSPSSSTSLKGFVPFALLPLGFPTLLAFRRRMRI